MEKSNYAKEKAEILLYTAPNGKVKVEIFCIMKTSG